MAKNNKNASQSSKSKKITTIVIILSVVCVILVVKYFKDATNLSALKISQAKIKGDEKAPIQIREFVDLQCPACANGVKILKKFMEDHPGEIRLELRYFPLKMHQHAMVAARYAECSAHQEKFWPFAETVFERQDQWKTLFDAHPAFDKIAQEVGMDQGALNSCLSDPKVDELIESNRQEGQNLGVQSTPTYFINGQMIVGTKNLEFELNKLISAQTTH